jgi:hypothetical protein
VVRGGRGRGERGKVEGGRWKVEGGRWKVEGAGGGRKEEGYGREGVGRHLLSEKGILPGQPKITPVWKQA